MMRLAQFPTNRKKSERRRRASPAGMAMLASATMAIFACAALSSLPAHAQVTTAVFAGDGLGGNLQNEVQATATSLAAPRDVAVASDGTVYIADTGHNQVRKVTPDGVIYSVFGTGSIGCDANGGNVLYQPGGIALDNAGNLYVSNTGCNFVERMAPDGTISVIAGRNTGFYTPVITDGMPATQAFLNAPSGLSYDNTNNVLYIADQGSARILKVAGGAISVAAGNVNGYNGYTGDNVSATGTELNYPADVLYAAGRLYIADSSNCRIRMVDTNNIISTIAGDGSCSDGPDGAIAAATNIAAPQSVAIDGAGNVYFSSGISGTIRMVDTNGTLSTPTAFIGGLGGLAFMPNGDLLVARPQFSQQVFRVSGLASTKPVPTVGDITPADPQQSDPMLTRGVYILPVQNGAVIDHYVYGWSDDPNATQPSTPLQISSSETGRLDYSDTKPNQDWYLMARAVTADGTAGPWSAPHKVHTPPTPLLIVGGDSLSSGHHLEATDPTTQCEDANYGYAAAYSARWMATIPDKNNWRLASAYINDAESGFALTPHAGQTPGTGSVTGGGKDACGNGQPVPLTDITSQLVAHRGSWNHFIITAGIDDTNWNSTIFAAIAGTAPLSKLPPLQSLVCSAIVRATWNGYSTSIQTSIENGVTQVLAAVHTADSAAEIDYQSYYNIVGTNSILPVACTAAVNNAVDKMHSTIKAGLPAYARFNDISSAMNGRTDLMQPLLSGHLSTNVVKLTGWPHPNQAGGAAIAALIPTN